MARTRNNSVPVMSCVRNRIIYRVSSRDAAAMLSAGTATWTSGRSAIRLTEPERETRGSQTCLSTTDMRVAAGEFGRSRTKNLSDAKRQERLGQGFDEEDFIERSEMKYQLWKEIH